MLLFAATASALTLDDAVRRAADVDPTTLIAEASAHIARLESTEAFAGQTVTPYLRANHAWSGGATSDSWYVGVTSGALDIGGWFDALQRRADAQAAGYDADAARLDAEYVTATLYMAVIAADASLVAAKHGQDVAQATLTATQARVNAGLESELVARSARLGLLTAQADVETATTGGEVARIALARALQIDAAGLTVEAPAPLTVGELSVNDSPVVKAARAARDAASWGHGQRVAELFPTGSISAGSVLSPMSWSVNVGFTWSFDGVIGSVMRERQAHQEERISEITLDAAVRDAESAVATALAQARSAARVVELAREREMIAEESLKVGQTRLGAGIASSLEVLRLQDEATTARAERITAELEAAAATLSARQAAGVPWGG